MAYDNAGMLLEPHDGDITIPVAHSSLGYAFLSNLPYTGKVEYGLKTHPSTSFLVNSRNTDGAPHQCPLGSDASYLCHFVLTCGCAPC